MSEVLKPVKSKKKIFELFAGVFFLLIVGVVIFLAIAANKENKKFLAEGIRVNATITDMEISGTRKNKSYSMTVSMFTEGEKKVIRSDTSGKTKITIKIDSLLDNALSKVASMGNYQSVSINVANTTYSKHKIGDQVDVVYLKEDQENVKLLEEID